MKKQEVFDYFCEHPESEVLMVLEKLGLDATAEDYPEDVIEKAESVFNIVSNAAKALPPTKNNAIAVLDAAELATSQLAEINITIPQDVLFIISHNAIEQLRQQALQIGQVARKAFINTLNQSQSELWRDVAFTLKQGQLHTEQTKIAAQQILNELCPPPENISVTEFSNRIKATDGEINDAKEKFDVNTFLANVKLKKGEK